MTKDDPNYCRVIDSASVVTLAEVLDELNSIAELNIKYKPLKFFFSGNKNNAEKEYFRGFGDAIAIIKSKIQKRMDNND